MAWTTYESLSFQVIFSVFMSDLEMATCLSCFTLHFFCQSLLEVLLIKALHGRLPKTRLLLLM